MALAARPAAAQDWFQTGTGLGVSKARLAVADFAARTPAVAPLATEFGGSIRPQPRDLWDRLHPYMMRFGKLAADRFCRLKRKRSHERFLTRKQQQQVSNS